jgi:hypothetical protein
VAEPRSPRFQDPLSIPRAREKHLTIIFCHANSGTGAFSSARRAALFTIRLYELDIEPTRRHPFSARGMAWAPSQSIPPHVFLVLFCFEHGSVQLRMEPLVCSPDRLHRSERPPGREIIIVTPEPRMRVSQCAPIPPDSAPGGLVRTVPQSSIPYDVCDGCIPKTLECGAEEAPRHKREQDSILTANYGGVSTGLLPRTPAADASRSARLWSEASSNFNLKSEAKVAASCSSCPFLDFPCPPNAADCFAEHE